MVAAQPVACLNVTRGDVRHDGSLATFPPAAAMVIGLVGAQTARSPVRATAPIAHPENDIECYRQHHAVVPVGRTQRDTERRSFDIDHKMTLHASAPRSVGFRPAASSPF